MKQSFEFKSFFMGGFESCYALNEHRQRLDLLKATRHDLNCRADYRRLKSLGIYTVRESLAWHEIDKGNGEYDFSRFESIMAAARDEGMQVIWSLNHFDFGEGADVFSPAFAERFTAYALAALQTIRKYDTSLLYLIPINEISFLAWMCADIGVWGPHECNRGWEAKKQMAGAVIAAVKAIKAIDPGVKFVHVDPVMRRIAGKGTGREVRKYVSHFREVVYEAWDMICGKKCPELGGKKEYLDIIGLNYYIANQDKVTAIEHTPEMRVSCKRLGLNSKYRVGFDQILRTVYRRYKRPVLVTETGSHGCLRKHWWHRILREIDKAQIQNIPVLGICAFPVIDRPDWHLGHLTNSGFWDFATGDVTCERIPHEDTLRIIRKYIQNRNRQYPLPLEINPSHLNEQYYTDEYCTVDRQVKARTLTSRLN